MPPRSPKRPHLIVSIQPEAPAYKGRGFKSPPPPSRDHATHSRLLLGELRYALYSFEQIQRPNVGVPLANGLSLEIQGIDYRKMPFDSLDSKKKHWSLRNVHVEDDHWEATIWVNQSHIPELEKKFLEYNTILTRWNKPKFQSWMSFLDGISLATLHSFWGGLEDFPESQEEIWWEIWLCRESGTEVEDFREICRALEIQTTSHAIHFHNASVLLAKATPEKLSQTLHFSDSLSEVRKASKIYEALNELSTREQQEWAELISNEIVPANGGSPFATIIDAGVNRNHPLLISSLNSRDCFNYKSHWIDRDQDQQGIPHGTGMASLALLGDLRWVFDSQGPIQLTHRLESVKILDAEHANEPHLFGEVIAKATSFVEIQNPSNKRAICLAITAENNLGGVPTSWSASIDALSCGRALDQNIHGDIADLGDYDPTFSRLYLISAGNTLNPEAPSPYRTPQAIEDPGQSWNALTVGASTNLCPSPLPHYTLLATNGEASPFTRDSIDWDSAWPLKPDIVMEGGNGYQSDIPHPQIITDDALSLITANANFVFGKPFAFSQGTSPATALAANLAAKIWAKYPNFRAETVRALIVHSARWTEEMFANLRYPHQKEDRVRGRRIWGHGIPNEDFALHSTNSRLTLIHEGVLHPFKSEKFREYHLLAFPWPARELEQFTRNLTLRVTLAYNIQPNPSNRAWHRRFSYASHGMRFKVRPPDMSTDGFKNLIVRETNEIEDGLTPPRSSIDWFFGDASQTKGSIHSDYCMMSGAAISRCGQIAVVPVSGWWKFQPLHDKSDLGVPYSMIISIEPEETQIDIYTPVKGLIENAVTVPVGR